MQRKSRLLLIEDEQAILTGLLDLFVYHGYDVDAVQDGQLGLEKALQGNYDLIILDIMLPRLDGFAICDAIRHHSREQPLIILTAKTTDEDIITGLTLGADDYVAKPFSPREVVSRVRAILRRANGKASIHSGKRFVVDNEGMRVRYCGELLSLTRYEFLLLSVLLERPGRVFSRTQLMDAVWNDAEDTMERTVDAHIKTVRAKLRSIAEIDDPIETHRGLGYSIRNDAL